MLYFNVKITVFFRKMKEKLKKKFFFFPLYYNLFILYLFITYKEKPRVKKKIDYQNR